MSGLDTRYKFLTHVGLSIAEFDAPSLEAQRELLQLPQFLTIHLTPDAVDYTVAVTMVTVVL